jgi:hypothetical protein
MVHVDITFDLDASQADEVTNLTGLPGMLAETRWAFVDDGSEGYGGVLTGALDVFGKTNEVEIETYDNLDLGPLGSPFGFDGVFDVLGLFFGFGDAVCDVADLSPVTGFCPPGSPTENGTDYGVIIFGDSSWFSGGNVLPSLSLPVDSSFRIFGDGSQYASNSETAFAAFEFNRVATVPLPAAGWALLTGLVGLYGIRRGRRTS